jgi:hypothetical protein
MFSSAKNEFSTNYPGLINALKNTFINIEIKTPGFLSSNSDVYLRSNLTVNNNQLCVNFNILKNNNKFDDIEFEIDYDYFIHNKINNKTKRFNLNSKIDFCDVGNKHDYIKYLNHLGIKNHLLSKFLDYNKTIYDVLEKPQGVIKHPTYWYLLNHKSVTYNGHTITSFDYENADLFNGYKHKSNFVLNIEIKDKNSILYETFILLDTFNMKEIKLTDYENVKNAIDTLLENFEQTPIHEILSKNFNTISLVKELTGKTYIKKHKQKIQERNITLDFNQLSHDELILLINDFMTEKFNSEILVFESSGFSLVNGNYVNPKDVVILANQMKQTQSILKNCLEDFLGMASSEDMKLLLSKTWDNLIREAFRSEVAKFQIRNNVKLFDKR